MKQIQRTQLKTLYSRLQESKRFIQVLAGPRQVGKTTIISQLLPLLSVPVTSVSADTVHSENAEWIADQWTAVRVQMQLQHQEEHILIIDEIQRLHNWSEVVKREWDADKKSNCNIKIVLLGSSRLLLADGLNESLAGRFEFIHVPHWTWQEMHEAFDFSLEQFIYFGGYPGAAGLIQNEKRWRQYIRQSIIKPSIEKDVLMTKRILKPALLRQVFDMGSQHSGELISLNKIVGQLQDAGNTTTVSNYVHTLQEAELLCGLPKYASDVVRQYQSIPKFQVFNTALQTAMHTDTFASIYADRQRWGRWVESVVGTHLMNYADEENYQVYYWRERNDEVDFVIATDSEAIGVEVKSGRQTAGKGLQVFRKRFPMAKTIVIGTGGIPLDVFLSANPSELL